MKGRLVDQKSVVCQVPGIAMNHPARLSRFALALLAGLAVTPSAGAQQQPPPGPEGGRPGRPPFEEGAEGPSRLFVSPMGEPFRVPRSEGNPVDRWFNGADTDHDGALSRAELAADATRFFNVLDRQHDGEIDPDDLQFYENVLLPEVHGGGGFEGGGFRRRGGPPGGGRPGGGRGGPGGGAPGGYGGGSLNLAGGSGSGGAGSGAGQDIKAAPPGPPAYGTIKQGAARYSFFDYPEPVIVADKNFNRGVSLQEFLNAADERFDALDTNGDGKIMRAELPSFEPPVSRGRGSRRGRGGFRPPFGDGPPPGGDPGDQ